MRFRPAHGRLLRRCFAPLALIAACTTYCEFVRSAEISELRRTPVVRAIEQNRAAIVNLQGQKTVPSTVDEAHDRSDGTRRVNGMGTGVVIDPRGYIITNYHVVDGVKNIQVTLANGKTYIGQLQSYDGKTDLALIKINCPEKLPVITVGTSSDLMIGEPVVAIGNAYGYEHTVTRGIISALHRAVQVSDVQDYDDLIQTDASINPGNSGGPLLNIDGQMIGLNVAVRAGAQGIGFAIPMDKVMSVATQLMSSQRLEGTWHGVISKPDAWHDAGLVVKDVESSSPAAKAGLKSGDRVTNVGDQNIDRPLDLERALIGRHPGEELQVTVQRDQKPVTMSLVVTSVGKRAESDNDPIWDTLGLRLSPIPASQVRQGQSSRYRGGLIVLAVRPDSPAAKQSIRRGDVLVGMHIWETVTLDNVNYVLNRPDFDDIEPLKFYILRGTETLYGHLTVSGVRR